MLSIRALCLVHCQLSLVGLRSLVFGLRSLVFSLRSCSLFEIELLTSNFELLQRFLLVPTDY